MLVLDTNVLLYAANESSEFHPACYRRLEHWRRDPSPVFITWNICYEFLRITTHPRVFPQPWNSGQAWGFVHSLLASPGISVLAATDRHAAVLARTLEEIPEARGNLMHDIHTVVVMREHGVSRICTRDTDFHRFPFLEVVDPLRI